MLQVGEDDCLVIVLLDNSNSDPWRLVGILNLQHDQVGWQDELP
jgi:hypothetical protein